MLISLSKIGKILNQSTTDTLVLSHYTIDSRNVQAGSLFFALKGARSDGHDYLEEVARSGAYAAVVDKDYAGPSYGMQLFIVDDVVDSLQEIARVMVQEKNFRVIGVTGSVGKTTTKEMIFHLLSKKFKVHANKRSFNSQRMLPITILEARGDEEFLILEMSMTEKGHINNLTSIAKPEIAVLTEVTYAHSENFDNLDQIAEAKSEIFSVDTKFAIIHEKSLKFNAVYKNCLCHNVIYPSKIPVISPYKESHFSQNFCAAYEVAKYLGMDDNQIRLAALSMVSKKIDHRFEKIQRDGILFIDDSYNANIVSTIAALENLPKPKDGGKTYFVFGAMSELGKMSQFSHKKVAKKALECVDVAFCIGKDAKIISEMFDAEGKLGRYFFDFRMLKTYLFKTVKSGDVVLIKGANSFKLWKLLESENVLT